MTTEIQHYETSPPAQAGLFGHSSPAEMVQMATEVATALAGVLVGGGDTGRRNLFMTIGSDRDGYERRHVYVEGWTLLGTMMRLHHVVQWSRPVNDDEGIWRTPKLEPTQKTLHSGYCPNGAKGHGQREGCQTYTKEVMAVVEAGRGGWEARVEVFNADGDTIAASEAECRWEETTWSTRDSYALRSMAQTRATSKALRQPLGFIVELAGFSATPAEEIPRGAEGHPETLERDSGPEYTGPRCPSCESPVYDNREDNEKRRAAGKKNMPMFKCKNRACKGGTGRDGSPSEWFTWEAAYYDPPTPDGSTTDSYINAAKKVILELVSDDVGWAGFAARYENAEGIDWPTITARDMAGRLFADTVTAYGYQLDQLLVTLAIANDLAAVARGALLDPFATLTELIEARKEILEARLAEAANSEAPDYGANPYS